MPRVCTGDLRHHGQRRSNEADEGLARRRQSHDAGHRAGIIGGIAVDATSVYWINGGSPNRDFDDGTVMKLTPK
jgi:hypothetical protein